MQQQTKLIPRPRLMKQVLQALNEAPVTVLLGARQTGKTTSKESSGLFLFEGI